jgi:hypothetical protein
MNTLIYKWYSSELLCRVIFWLYESIAEEYSASIFGTKDEGIVFLRNVDT